MPWECGLSSLLRAWYVFLALSLVTFMFTAFIGRVPYALTSAIAPPAQLFYRVGLSLRDAASSVVDRRDLRTENAVLGTRLAQLETENRRLEIELERLQQLLEVRETQPGAALSAAVLEVSPSPLLRRVTVAKGSSSGVKLNMPVTTPVGLVGIVTDVIGRRASVRAITDPESAVGVTVRGGGGQGIAVGIPGGLVRVEDFKEDAPVEVGDIVETNSRGGFFPRGLTVGTVVEVPPRNPNDLRIQFIVQPAVDATLLTDVILLEPL